MIVPLFVAVALSTSISTPPSIVPLLTSSPALPALACLPITTPISPPELVPALLTDPPLPASTPYRTPATVPPSSLTTPPRPVRSEHRRVVKECVSTCRSRGSPYH